MGVPGRPWRLHPSRTRFVTSPRIGYASRPNSELTAEVLHLLDLQPCWLLLPTRDSCTAARRSPYSTPSSARSRIDWTIQQAGSSRRHWTPAAGNSRSTVPPNSYGIRSQIVFVPKPGFLGVTTEGPPTSRQSRIRIGCGCPFSRCCHRIDTCPFWVDSAPYFAALVASS